MRLTIKTKLAATFVVVVAMAAGKAASPGGFDLDLGEGADELDAEFRRDAA